MKGKNILWVSRHPPNDEQTMELEKAFGHVHVIEISKSVRDGQEIKDLMTQYKASEVVAVLPITMMAQLTQLGIQPLRAVMDRHVKENGEVEFQHEHFERVRSVEIITEPLLEE